ncbi:fibronectin type III domain-containing protein [Robertkochia aurantiaca]|uniref:fibronectin type III domain-containing protein n=1 Tax=Robertkochia aurantiaca TaxID=2873700 RepID=UPI001CCE4A1F|nr:fibronectin type III domain-containing protein [Robertkochia sp. 3YJGBD-33]
MSIKRSLIVFICFLNMLPGLSQIYPVRTTAIFKQPVPIYLSAFADPVRADQLRLQILLTDLGIESREIRIKMFFQGNGIRFQSYEALPLTYEIQGGIPLMLDAFQLAPYFNPENTEGLIQEHLGKSVPEGPYQVCFEVYDHATGKRISGKDCQNLMVFHNEPPFLVHPQRNAIVQVQDLQNILFQWTPRQINVSKVLYELSIVEVWDHGIDPQTAFLGSVPVFRTVTDRPFYNYGPSDPLLLPDRRYAWRVRVFPREGAEEIGFFKNEGYSEINWFDHVSPCEPALNSSHEVKGQREVNVYWENPLSAPSVHIVRYREPGEGNHWFYARSAASFVTLWDLRPGTVYEYQVSRKCEFSESRFSEPRHFTTAINTVSDLSDCGFSPAIKVATQVPVSNLRAHDVFHAGDFPVKILEISESGGRYTGHGYATIPYLGNLKVPVRFSRIKVNKEFQLYDGMVVTGYDKNWTNVADIDAIADGIEDLSDILTGDDHHALPVLPGDISTEDIQIDEGSIIIRLNDGKEIRLDHDEGDTYLVTDASGDQWEIDEEGNITQVGEGAEGGPVSDSNTEGVFEADGETEIATIFEDQVTFRFQTDERSHFAFDPAESLRNPSAYRYVQDQKGDKVFPPHKALVSGKEEVFYADYTLKDSTFSTENLVVKTKSGRAVDITIDTIRSRISFRMRGLNSLLSEELLITSGSDSISKNRIHAVCFLHHLKQHRPVKVQMVYVNQPHGLTGLEPALNTIFSPVGVNLQLEEDKRMQLSPSQWDTEDPNGIIDLGNSGPLADYAPELRNFFRLFKESHPDYESDAYHIFVLGKDFRNSKALKGYMPVGRRWGFIFQESLRDTDQADISKMIAHELGHGVFGLEHSFSGPGEAESGQHLMDYGKGIFITQQEWGKISEAEQVISLFEDDTSQEIGKKIWFTPNWEPFTIEGTRTISSGSMEGVPPGTIPGFRYRGTYYNARFEEGVFTGYWSDDDDLFEYEVFSGLAEDQKVYLFENRGGCGFNRYYQSEYRHLEIFRDLDDFAQTAELRFIDVIPCADKEGARLMLFDTPVCDLTGESVTLDSLGIRRSSEMIRAHLKAQPEIPQSVERKPGEYYHLVGTREHNLDGKADILEDKFRLLYEKTGVRVLVVFSEVDQKMHPGIRDNFAERVLESVREEITGDLLLITVPYFNLYGNFTEQQCLQPGFAQSNAEVIPAEFMSFRKAADLYTYLLGIFAAAEKPMMLKRYFLKADGSLIDMISQTDEVRGFPFISKMEFYESQRLQEAEKLRETIRLWKQREEDFAENPLYFSEFMRLRNQWTAQYNAILLKAEEEETASFRNNDLAWWSTGDFKLGKLREVFIEDSLLANTYVAAQVKGDYLERWKVLFARSSLEEDHFYDYDPWILVDTHLYPLFDLASLIPVLERPVEVFGLTYASYRNDLEAQALYATSLVIPFGGSAVVRNGVKKLADTPASYAAVGYRNTDEVVIDLKSIRKIGAGEVQLTPVLTSNAEAVPYVRQKVVNDEALKKLTASLLRETDILTERAAFWKRIKDEHFPNEDWSQTVFETHGLVYEEIEVNNFDLINEMRVVASNDFILKKLPEIIESGSTLPVKTNVEVGKEFYKLVPKGNEFNYYSPYYLDQETLEYLQHNPSQIESVLGLPLSSVSSHYDVYRVISIGESYFYRSKIASTSQSRMTPKTDPYRTKGGAIQNIILNIDNDNLWKKEFESPLFVLEPSELPNTF